MRDNDGFLHAIPDRFTADPACVMVKAHADFAALRQQQQTNLTAGVPPAF
jgi:hypothetical protein